MIADKYRIWVGRSISLCDKNVIAKALILLRIFDHVGEQYIEPRHRYIKHFAGLPMHFDYCYIPLYG
jgi:hypothetical protein